MPKSVQSIYLDHRALLLGQAQRIVRDRETAEDVIQESYLRAHRAAEKGPIENVAAFLCRTVRNLALDHLRRRQARACVEIGSSDMVEVSHVACGNPSAEDRMLQRERLDRFRHALDSLPERARQVWILNRLEGWSYPVIAEHLGVSPGTVFNECCNKAEVSGCPAKQKCQGSIPLFDRPDHPFVPTDFCEAAARSGRQGCPKGHRAAARAPLVSLTGASTVAGWRGR